MKRKISIFVAVVVCLSCALTLFACNSGAKITLTNYPDSIDFHTDLQTLYLTSVFGSAYQPNEESDEVNGRTELSRPDAVTLSWQCDKDVKSYTVEVSETSDFATKRTFNVTQKSVEVYNLKIATTYYWRVIADGTTSETGVFGTMSNGPRNLYVDGVTNFRDVGGWMTSSGNRMKQGILYRSARLNASYKLDENGEEVKYVEPDNVVEEITEEGKKVFVDELGIKTEVDFRLDERNGYPAGTELKSVVDGVNYVALPMNGGKNMFTTSDEQIKSLMETIADSNNLPLVYHCNIGTDRTGMISYLIGALCGMNAHDLLVDYLFSNFGNIGDTKSPVNSYNTYFGLDGYEGDTLQERAQNFFLSIGVSQLTLDKVIANLVEDNAVSASGNDKIYLYDVDNVPYDSVNKDCHNYCFVTPYIAANPTGGAVVVFPGGGYNHLSNATNKGGKDNDGDQKESSSIAALYNAAGISVFVVNYRTTAVDENVNYKQIVADGMRAIKVVRANAAKFNVNLDKIAVQGYSAGGHLASVLLTTSNFTIDDVNYKPDEVDNVSAKVNAGVLCYAVTNIKGSLAHKGTASVFGGGNDEILVKYNSVDNVTADAAPCYLWCHKGDKSVNYQNTQTFADALQQNGVDYVLDIFDDNGLTSHGLGVAWNVTDASVWTANATAFLKNLGF